MIAFMLDHTRVKTARHAFDPRCPWPGGERNHIQMDLSDIGEVEAALPHIHAIVFLRALPGPDFSTFDPDLTGDGARALLLREWDAWRNRGQ